VTLNCCRDASLNTVEMRLLIVIETRLLLVIETRPLIAVETRLLKRGDRVKRFETRTQEPLRTHVWLRLSSRYAPRISAVGRPIKDPGL